MNFTVIQIKEAILYNSWLLKTQGEDAILCNPWLLNEYLCPFVEILKINQLVCRHPFEVFFPSLADSNSEGLFGGPIRQAMARHRESILLIFQARVTSVVPLHLLYFRHLLTHLLLVTNCPLRLLYFLLPSFLVTQNVFVLLYFLTCSKFGFTSIYLPICSCTSEIQVAFVLLISLVSH